MPKKTVIIPQNHQTDKVVADNDSTLDVTNNSIECSYSVMDSVMGQIKDKEPEKAEIVTIRRYLIMAAISFGVFLAAAIFTLFLVDLMDKLTVLDFIERSPYEVVFKLAIEFILITCIFTAIAYLLYRHTVLPWAKDRLKLFIGLFVIVFVIAGTLLTVVQTNTFGSRSPFVDLKDLVSDFLPFRRGFDDSKNIFVGRVIDSTPEFLIAQQHRRIPQKFLWQDNYESVNDGQMVIIQYELDNDSNKIIDKIQLFYPPQNFPSKSSHSRNRPKVPIPSLPPFE